MNIENKIEKKSYKLDTWYWALVATLVVTGIALNHHFAEISLPLRLTAWIVLICVVLFVAFQTEKGKNIWQFAKDARIELAKVVWPTRQETVHITLVIAALVVLMALFMWGVDSILMWTIGRLTGSR